MSNQYKSIRERSSFLDKMFAYIILVKVIWLRVDERGLLIIIYALKVEISENFGGKKGHYI